MSGRPRSPRPLDPRRAVTVREDGTPRDYQAGPHRVTFVPLAIKRRQNRKLLAPPPGQSTAQGAPEFDLPMIMALGKGFYWQRLIDEGQYAHATELARALKLDPGWVAEVMRLTLLAPDIVEAVLEGRQPRALHLHLLRGREEVLPWDWEAQRRVLGKRV